jgi:Uma2 family endonuclease
MNERVTTDRRPATYRDVLDAPPHVVAELVRGVLHLQPRPAFLHARTASALGGEVYGPFDRGRGGPGGWWILDGPELDFGEDVVVPDLAGWRRERMPAISDAPWSELPPDWICEVLSPGTRRLDLIDKREIYGEAGVGHLWLVDPKARTLEAFERREGAWVLLGALREDAEVRLPPFDAVAFPLAALWAD